MYQKNKSNNQDRYDECKYYFDKIEQDAAIIDDYNFSADDYSEDIDTDLESPTSFLSSKAIEPNQYVKIHQNLTPIEPQQLTTQNPSAKIIQGINSQRLTHYDYLPHHTTIVTSPNCHPPAPPADVTEIYRRHCKKNKITATIMPQQLQRSPILMLSGEPTTVLDQKLPTQYYQQQPQILLRCVPTPAEDKQQIYLNNRSRNCSCRCYKRTSNVGTALYKPSSKHCLPVSQPEYPSYNTISTRNNRTSHPQHRVGEATDEINNNSERVEYESSPGYYIAPDGSYNVIQQEKIPPHPKKKLKNKFLTLINPKRVTNNAAPAGDMDGLLAHFETLFDIKEKEYIDGLSTSKENVKGNDKTVPSNVKSVKCIPSQTALKISRISSLLLKSKQNKLKNFTKLKKCASTTNQQMTVSKTRIKKKHDKTNTSNTNSSKINNSNTNINNDNKSMIDDITLNNKIISIPKDVISSVLVVDDQQQQREQPSQHPFGIGINSSESLDSLLADLLASGFINQEQHDKNKSINQKMREDAQKIINGQSMCSSPRHSSTSKKRLVESPPHANNLVDEEGDNNSITNSCVGSTDNTSNGEIDVTNSSKINNNMITNNHNISMHDRRNTSASSNDQHGTNKSINAPTSSMPILSSSNIKNNHISNNNTNPSPNFDDIKDNLLSYNNSIQMPEKSQSQNLILLSKSDTTKSYSHISSQTNHIETKDSIEFSTKSMMSNLNCDTVNSKINLLQMNLPLTSTTSLNHHNQNMNHDEDGTVALELHRSKSFIIKLIDRALSKELGTAQEPQLAVESPSSTNRPQVLPNANIEASREKSENVSLSTANAETCFGITDINAEIIKEQRPSTSIKINKEEASCLKQLKLLRWSHLKHIQEEVQRLQDLERFLDSCNAK